MWFESNMILNSYLKITYSKDPECTTGLQLLFQPMLLGVSDQLLLQPCNLGSDCWEKSCM